MRAVATTLLEVVGLGSVTTGAALVYVPAGWIVGGLSVVLVGALLGRPVAVVVPVGDEVA